MSTLAGANVRLLFSMEESNVFKIKDDDDVHKFKQMQILPGYDDTSEFVDETEHRSSQFFPFFDQARCQSTCSSFVLRFHNMF